MDDFKRIIDQYRKRLDEIKEHIEFISLQKDLYKDLKDDISMDRYSTNLLRIMNSTVQYNSIIICLYGCFEEFVDEIASKYIDIINSLCVSYDELPESIRNKHLNKVGDFLSNPQRYKGYELTVCDCIRNFYLSITSAEGRILNKELILSHAGNLKIEKIYYFFQELGVSTLKPRIENDLEKAELKLLDELVDQRNVISHSWEVEQRFSLDKIKDEIVELLISIGEIIRTVLLDEIFLFMYEKGKFDSFDSPIEVINNKILCINSKYSYLKTGDSILLCKNNDKMERLEILEIQKNGNKINKIEEKNINVGIKVNNKIDKEWKYYYLRENYNRS